jgi:hypothetical protein
MKRTKHRSLARRLLLIPLILFGLATIVASGGGDGGSGFGEGGGETRRFNQYPLLLAIEGNGVIEAGQTQGLAATADTAGFSRNSAVSDDETYGVDVTGAPMVAPARPELSYRQGSDIYQAGFTLTAPSSVSSVTNYRLLAVNPRGNVAREVYVVPAGHLYVKRMALEFVQVVEGAEQRELVRILTSTRTARLTLELSQPAPANTTIALRASEFGLTLPASAPVSAGQRSVTVDVTAAEVSSEAYVTIFAQLGGTEQALHVWVRSATPFLRALRLPERLNRGENVGYVELSASAAGGATVELASNNTLVTVPATATVNDGQSTAAFPVDVVDQVIPFTSVRITASYRGTTRIADAELGQLAGAPELERIDVDQESELNPGTPAFSCISFDTGASPRIPAVNERRVFIALKMRASHPSDVRVRVYSGDSLALVLDTETTVPAGALEHTVLASVRPGPNATTELIRFIPVRARIVSTGQEVSTPVQVDVGSGNSFEDFGPLRFNLSALPPYLGGTLLTGQIVMTQSHRWDEVPVEVQLRDLNGGAPLASATTRAYQGYATARLQLPLPTVGADTSVELRASVPLTDVCGHGRRAAVTRFTLSPGGGALRDVLVARDGLFNGETARVTVRLAGPAPATGGRVAITSSLAPAALAGVPTEVAIAGGQSEASFDVSVPSAPSGVLTAQLTATYQGVSKSATLYVLPEPGAVRVLLDPTVVVGGQATRLRVEISPPYPIPLDIALSSGSASVPVPASLRFAPNVGLVDTMVTTAVVTAAETVSVSARLRNFTGVGLLTVNPAVVARSWQLVGGALNRLPAPSQVGVAPAIELNAAQMPIVAFNEQGNIYVSRWNGSAWTALGGALNVAAASGSSPSLALDAAGEPYVAWDEGAEFSRNVYLKRWDGAQWVAVGPSGGQFDHDPAADAREPQLRLRGTQPVAAWVEGDRIVVKQYNTAAAIWTTLAGAALGPSGTVSRVLPTRLQLVISSVSSIARASVAWIDAAGNVSVSDEIPGWPLLGPPVFVNAFNVSGLALTVEAAARVAISQDFGDRVYRARRFSGASWQQIGDVLGGPGANDSVGAIATSRSLPLSTPIVGWTGLVSNDSTLSVRRWDGSVAWQPVGTPIINHVGRYGAGAASELSIVDGNLPALAYVIQSSSGALVDRAVYVRQYR